MAATNAAEAGVVLSRVLHAVASHRFSASRLRPGQVTVSIGVTESNGKEAPDDVVRRADTELYAAKRNGRNRVAVSAQWASPGGQGDDPALS